MIYRHKNFGDLSKEKLDSYLDFLATTLFKLTGFEVWESENVFDVEDNDKWNKEALRLFDMIISDKHDLEDKIISYDIKHQND